MRNHHNDGYYGVLHERTFLTHNRTPYPKNRFRKLLVLIIDFHWKLKIDIFEMVISRISNACRLKASPNLYFLLLFWDPPK